MQAGASRETLSGMAKPFNLGAVPGEESGPLRRSTEAVVEEEREVLH